MSLFLKLSDVKNKISNEVWKNKSELLNIVDDYININKGIYYKDGSEIYINANFVGYVNHRYKKMFEKKPWLPIFDNINIEFDTRYVVENGIEVDYDLSETKRQNLLKGKKFAGKNQFRNKSEKRVKTPEEKKALAEQRKAKEEKRLASIQSHLDNIKKAIFDGKNLIAFDTEAWEHDSKCLLEIGYSFYEASTGKFENKNLVIREHLEKRKGRFVADNKFNFLFGETFFVSEKEALEIFNNLIKKADVLIGHALKNDMKIVNSAKKTRFDTQIYGSHLHGKHGSRMSLEKLATTLNLEPQFLHNAGNDAYYTMQSALKLIS